MILTNQIIESFGTSGCGFSRKQLEILGVSWPPEKGWKSRLCGSQISDHDYSRLMALKKKSKIPSGDVSEEFRLSGSIVLRMKGKYYGEKMSDIPKEYLKWMSGNCYVDKHRELAKNELERRKWKLSRKLKKPRHHPKEMKLGVDKKTHSCNSAMASVARVVSEKRPLADCDCPF